MNVPPPTRVSTSRRPGSLVNGPGHVQTLTLATSSSTSSSSALGLTETSQSSTTWCSNHPDSNTCRACMQASCDADPTKKMHTAWPTYDGEVLARGRSTDEHISAREWSFYTPEATPTGWASAEAFGMPYKPLGEPMIDYVFKPWAHYTQSKGEKMAKEKGVVEKTDQNSSMSKNPKARTFALMQLCSTHRREDRESREALQARLKTSNERLREVKSGRPLFDLINVPSRERMAYIANTAAKQDSSPMTNRVTRRYNDDNDHYDEEDGEGENDEEDDLANADELELVHRALEESTRALDEHNNAIHKKNYYSKNQSGNRNSGESISSLLTGAIRRARDKTDALLPRGGSCGNESSSLGKASQGRGKGGDQNDQNSLILSYMGVLHGRSDEEIKELQRIQKKLNELQQSNQPHGKGISSTTTTSTRVPHLNLSLAQLNGHRPGQAFTTRSHRQGPYSSPSPLYSSFNGTSSMTHRSKSYTSKVSQSRVDSPEMLIDYMLASASASTSSSLSASARASATIPPRPPPRPLAGLGDSLPISSNLTKKLPHPESTKTLDDSMKTSTMDKFGVVSLRGGDGECENGDSTTGGNCTGTIYLTRKNETDLVIKADETPGTRLSQRYRRQKESNPAYRMERLLNLVTLKATQLESMLHLDYLASTPRPSEPSVPLGMSLRLKEGRHTSSSSSSSGSLPFTSYGDSRFQNGRGYDNGKNQEDGQGVKVNRGRGQILREVLLTDPTLKGAIKPSQPLRVARSVDTRVAALYANFDLTKTQLRSRLFESLAIMDENRFRDLSSRFAHFSPSFVDPNHDVQRMREEPERHRQEILVVRLQNYRWLLHLLRLLAQSRDAEPVVAEIVILEAIEAVANDTHDRLTGPFALRLVLNRLMSTPSILSEAVCDPHSTTIDTEGGEMAHDEKEASSIQNPSSSPRYTGKWSPAEVSAAVSSSSQAHSLLAMLKSMWAISPDDYLDILTGHNIVPPQESHSKFPSLDQPSRLNLRSVNGLSSGNGAGTTTDQQGNEGNTLTPTDGNAGNQSAVGGTGGSNPNNASVQNGGNEDGAGQTGHRGNKQKWEDPAQVGQIIADGVVIKKCVTPALYQTREDRRIAIRQAKNPNMRLTRTQLARLPDISKRSKGLADDDDELLSAVPFEEPTVRATEIPKAALDLRGGSSRIRSEKTTPRPPSTHRHLPSPSNKKGTHSPSQSPRPRNIRRISHGSAQD